MVLRIYLVDKIFRMGISIRGESISLRKRRRNFIQKKAFWEKSSSSYNNSNKVRLNATLEWHRAKLFTSYGVD